jgi:hypothetical protein
MDCGPLKGKFVTFWWLGRAGGQNKKKILKMFGGLDFN